MFIAGITVAVKQVFAGHELKQRRRNRACADAAFVRQRCRSQLLPLLHIWLPPRKTGDR